LSSGPAKRALVVDDEPNIVSSVAGLLSDEGYEVATAQTGGAGLEMVRAHPFDVALFDVKLPDLDGIALLEQAQALRPELPVIMMSGHASIDLAVRAVRLGAYDFLEKPLHPERLLVIVRNASERGTLVAENRRLRDEHPADPLVGASAGIAALREVIARVAPTRGRVLLLGESGTGKELVARALHDGSPRAAGPFVKVNCAAIPHDLIESTLFGHERGAFTGAVASAAGKFEQAHRGTLLLDEVGDMHLDTQAKLLRVLEAGEIERVGGRRAIGVDVRVIAATNKNPLAEVAAGRFREDLYFRLAVVPIEVPPLRERGDDVILLAEHYLERFAREYGRAAPRLGASARDVFRTHRWPGNVRELKNVMERAVILMDTSPIDAAAARRLLDSSQAAGARSVTEVESREPHDEAGPTPPLAPAPAGGSLSERIEGAERGWIRDALARHHGRVADAARELQIDRANLHRKMRRLGIPRR
jgi:DNA-binding NtrC family response regulator